jgi:hypothetical protein
LTHPSSFCCPLLFSLVFLKRVFEKRRQPCSSRQPNSCGFLRLSFQVYRLFQSCAASPWFENVTNISSRHSNHYAGSSCCSCQQRGLKVSSCASISILSPFIAPQAIVSYRSSIYFLSPPTGWAAFPSLIDIAGQYFKLTIL